MNAKTTLILILFLTLATTTVYADETLTSIQYQDLKTQIVTEAVKTRTENALYTDRKIAEMTLTVENEIKPYVDQNFEIFDESMRLLAIKFQVQLAITILCVVIFSNATWYWIRRTIDKKRGKIPKNLKKDTFTADKYGLISPEHQEMMTRQDKTIIKHQPFHDVQQGEVEPPSMTSIERIIAQKREKEKQLLEAQQEKERVQFEKKRIETELQISKLKEKAKNKTKRLTQKIEELESKMPMPPPNEPI